MFHVWRPSWVMSLISCVSASPGPLKVMVMMAPDGKALVSNNNTFSFL